MENKNKYALINLLRMKMRSNAVVKGIDTNQKSEDRKVKQQNADTSRDRLELDQNKYIDKKVNQTKAKSKYKLTTDPTEATRTTIGNYEFEKATKKPETLVEKQDRYMDKLAKLESERGKMKVRVDIWDKEGKQIEETRDEFFKDPASQRYLGVLDNQIQAYSDSVAVTDYTQRLNKNASQKFTKKEVEDHYNNALNDYERAFLEEYTRLNNLVKPTKQYQVNEMQKKADSVAEKMLAEKYNMTPEQIRDEFEDIGAEYLKERTKKTFGSRYMGIGPKNK